MPSIPPSLGTFACYPTGGWMAVEMWAHAVRGFESPAEISGYPVITQYLADATLRVDAASEETERLRTAAPADTSSILLGLSRTETARKLDAAISPPFQERLRRNADRLSAIVAGREAAEAGASQLTRYAVSLSVGVPHLLKKLTALAATSPFPDTQEDLKTQCEEAERYFWDLTRYDRVIRGARKGLIRFHPDRFRMAMETIAQLLQKRSTVIDATFLILQAADSFDPALAERLSQELKI